MACVLPVVCMEVAVLSRVALPSIPCQGLHVVDACVVELCNKPNAYLVGAVGVSVSGSDGCTAQIE